MSNPCFWACWSARSKRRSEASCSARRARKSTSVVRAHSGVPGTRSRVWAAEDGRPPQIIGAAVDGLLIADAGMVLEQNQQGHLGRGDAGPPVGLAIEIGEGVLREKRRSRQCQLGVEGGGVQFQVKDIPDVEELGLLFPFADHACRLLGPARGPQA